jgi:hypothetical protein
MNNCKNCNKIIKEGYYRCFKCNQVFQEAKRRLQDGEVETTTDNNGYKFGKISQQIIRQEN